MTEIKEILSDKAKLIGGILLGGIALMAGAYFYFKGEPKRQIKYYKENGRVKKPRKWRRILRRSSK